MENQKMEKSRKELAAEGEKVLEDAVEAAFQVLSTMNEAFCNPAVWSKPEASRSDHALRYPRRRFKAAVGSLRVLLISIPHSHMDVVGAPAASQEDDQIKKLEEHISNMRMEFAKQNRHLKHLIDQLGYLITDISTWQSPCPL